MAGIHDILGIPPEARRVNKNDDVKQHRIAKNAQSAKTSTDGSKHVRDQAQISSEARQLLTLKQEARQYLDEVKSASTLSEHDIQQIKQKMESKYFLDSDVIDKIVEKLINLPNFLE